MRLLVLFVLLAGCATKEGVWVKHPSTQQEFDADRGGCIAQAFQAPTAFQQAAIFAGCMQSKGWRWEERD